ncbi:hypothetical protein EZV73_26015 [Acidaminobacter sp. JC074]|uniref:hypothetical protein n=1 Tax=Acidaminobacter sp. JC074 TaxID=2530199 RepID=UPI001F0D0090|nr:hypothetical protein [Acidaminobacter sp. JC074]MCH4891061.1 hypothetical protein [Acidaminobacter sp. JC074]
MKLTDIIFNLHMHFKVVHSLPGRVRLHVPVAKKVPKEWRFGSEYFDYAKMIPGVVNFDFNYVTCNALIEYDAKLTNEKKVITDMKSIAYLANEHKNAFKDFESDDKDKIVTYFSGLVKSHFSGEEVTNAK